jgi:hypothetical protein
MCEASTTTEFPIHSSADTGWMVAGQSRSRQVMRDTAETESVTRFSDCRESTPASSPSSRQSDPLPPGQEVSLVFTTPIDTDVAAAGDTISAKLTEPVVAGLKVLAPVGAIVTGRIIGMKHQLAQPKVFVISVAFDTIEANGAASPFYATLISPVRTQDQPGNQKLKDWPHGTFAFPSRGARYVVQVPFESHWRTVKPPALR